MTSPNTPESSQPVPPSGPSSPRKRNWKKILLISGGGAVVGGFFLVLLAPTLLSTGVGKSIVLGQVNARLNGKVEIDSWSLGWFSPISLDGIKVYDDQNRLALTVSKVTTGVTILKAARGNLDIGDVVVESPNLVLVEMNADGTNNFAKMVKVAAGEAKAPAAPASPGAPSKLPEVTGTVTIKNLTGAISGTAVGPQPIRIEHSDIALKIPSLQTQPISDDVKLTIHRDGSQPGTITVAGDLQAISAGFVDLGKLKVNQKVSLAGIDLSSANAFLSPAGLKLTVGGIADGTIDAKVDGLDSATVKGEIKIAKLSAGGEMLKGDTFASELMTVPLSISTSKNSDGSPQVKVESLGVSSAEVTASVNASVSLKTLQNLAAQNAPGGAGNANVDLSVPDVAKLAAQLPHLLQLGKGVSVTGGAVAAHVNVAINPAAATVLAALKVENVAGTNAGRAISLAPISLDADAELGFAHPGAADVRIQKAGLSSGFASASLMGSQSDITFNADVSLDKAKAQLGQFVDFGKADIAGGLKASGTVKGDLLGHAPAVAALHVEQSNLRVSGVGSLGTINVDRLVADASSTVQIAADNAISAKDAKIKLEVGLAASLVVRADVSVASVDVSSQSLSKFDVAADVTDLKEVQQRFGGLVKVLADNHLTFRGGSVHVAAAGDVKNAKPVLSAPARIELKQVTLYRDQAALLSREDLSLRAEASSPDDFKTIQASVDVTGGLVSATIKDATLNVANPSDVWNLATAKQIVVQVNDLSRLQAVANAFAPSASPWTVQTGSLQANLSVGRAGTVTTVDVSSLMLRGVQARNALTSVVTMKRDVSLKLSVAVDAAAGNGPDIMHQIRSATVTALDGSLGVANIKLDEPLVVTDLGAAVPTAKGALTISGNIVDITSVVEALQGTPGSLAGYSGSYVLKQRLTADGGMTAATGTLEADVQLKDKSGKVLFSDPKIQVVNDVAVNTKSMDLKIGKLGVTMSTGAADVNVTGAVKDLNKSRTISEPVKVALKYDLAKIMPLLQPVMPPTAAQHLAGSTITGQFSKDIVVTGSLPAGVPFEQGIQSLSATGGVAVATADLPVDGIHLGNFDQAFKLEKGVVTLSMAKPADLNGGQLNLNTRVSLAEAVPHLDMADGSVLVTKIALNKVLADKMGTFFGPIFVNTDKASGLVTVKFDKCVRVPLSDLAMQNVPANDGMAQVTLDIENLELVGGFAGDFVRHIPAIGSLFVGNVKQAKFTIQHGVVDSDLPITVGSGVNTGMRFTGKIELFGDQRLNPMNVRVGSNLLKDKIPLLRDVVQLADPVFVIKGTLTHPELDFAAGIGQWLKDQGKGLLPGVLGGGVPGSQSSTQPADKKGNPLGDAIKGLEGLGKKKKK